MKEMAEGTAAAVQCIAEALKRLTAQVVQLQKAMQTTTADKQQKPQLDAKIRRDGRWWVDCSGNRWDCNQYTELEAQEAAATLKFCADCKNCRDCEDCHKCSSCLQCRHCEDCADCERCISCSSCSFCRQCKYCTDCSYCEECKGCKDCTNCRMCERCEKNFADSE